VLLGPPPPAAESLWIAVTDDVVPADAPVARTTAEHVVFPLLYAPTVHVDCDGQPRATGAAGDEPASHELTDSAPTSADRSLVLPPSRTGAPWPSPTGPYRLDAAADTMLHLIPRAGADAPTLRVGVISPERGRDALDAGVDVLITADATTIEYAAQRSDLARIPLPWDRVYVLIEPVPPSRMVQDMALALRTELAHDAVRVEAQPADDRQWWDGLGACRGAVPTMPPVGPRPVVAAPTRRIVYQRHDHVARALSERLVALANAGSRSPLGSTSLVGPPLRAAGLDTTQYREALAAGDEAGYVAALPLHVGDACQSTVALLADVPWVARGDRTTTDQLFPLVETRAHAIVRPGRVGLSVDWLGNVSLEFGHRPSS